MPKVHRVAVVPYTPEQMFELVNNVEAYPQFLPWCKAASSHEVQAGVVEATLVFAAGPLRKAFTTCNRLEYPCAIGLNLVAGPFKSLHGNWHFTSTPEGCKVSLSLTFAYANRLAEAAIGIIFEQALEKMLPCFIERAEQIYGH